MRFICAEGETDPAAKSLKRLWRPEHPGGRDRPSRRRLSNGDGPRVADRRQPERHRGSREIEGARAVDLRSQIRVELR